MKTYYTTVRTIRTAVVGGKQGSIYIVLSKSAAEMLLVMVGHFIDGTFKKFEISV
jgi:hypothetical protein